MNEQEVLRDVAKMARKRYGLKHKPRSTNILYLDNYTVVIIPSKSGNTPKSVGVAKRNPMDPYSPEIGLRLAYSRALRSLAGAEASTTP